MKKLSIILVFCLLLQIFCVAAFAEPGEELSGDGDEGSMSILPVVEDNGDGDGDGDGFGILPVVDDDGDGDGDGDGFGILPVGDDEGEGDGDGFGIGILPVVDDDGDGDGDGDGFGIGIGPFDDVPVDPDAYVPVLARLAADSMIYGNLWLTETLYVVADEAVVYTVDLEEGAYRIQYNYRGAIREAYVPEASITVMSDDEAADWQTGEHSEDAILNSFWYLEPVRLEGGEGGDPTGMTLMSEDDFVIEGGVLTEYKGTSSGVIEIPSSVTSIADNVFAGHREITSVVLPSGLTSIGSGAFSGCTRLAGVALPDGVTAIPENAFAGCTALAAVEMPAVTSIGEGAFRDCTALQSLTLPDGLTTIADYAFYNCSGLRTVEFPTSLTSIGGNAFANCPALTQVLLGDCTSLTSLGVCAFAGDAAVNRLTLPSSLTEIPDYAFMYCGSLMEVKIPTGVTRIGVEAFSGCRILTGVDIEEDVTEIAAAAFAGCAPGCSFYFNSHPPVMGDHCIPAGSFVYGTHNTPIDNPEYYCMQNGVTFVNSLISKFAGRCYNTILGRPGELAGISYWSRQLAAQTLTGAACVAKFVNSEEFNGQNLDNAEKVTRLYKTMLDREPDTDGLNYWVGLLENGLSMDFIINGFATAPEFSAPNTGICAQYGIVAGTLPLTQARDLNPNVTAFVARCYLQVLDRPFDVDGLNYWCGNILFNKMSGAVLVDSFVNTPEFAARGLDSGEQVDILYQTMLNRPADTDGRADWVNILDSYGVTVRNIISGFADAREFRLLCRQYGISSGSLNNLEPRDKNRMVTRFVMTCYENAYAAGEYTPSPADLNYYTQIILSRSKTPAQVAHDFLFSRDFIERGVSDQDFVKILYRVYLGRGVDPQQSEINIWTARFASGMTRDQAAAEFARTSEYYTYCKTMGLV